MLRRIGYKVQLFVQPRRVLYPAVMIVQQCILFVFTSSLCAFLTCACCVCQTWELYKPDARCHVDEELMLRLDEVFEEVRVFLHSP
jgi:hypothetical protein